MYTIETGSNYKLYEESMCKKRLLSIAIISPMRKSQKNKLQKLSVSRNESRVLQIEWLWSEWYVECVICFEVSFQMSRATHKYIQEHNACLIPGQDALLTLLKNLNFFPISQYLHSFGCSGSQKAFLILINIFQLQRIYFLGRVTRTFCHAKIFWEVRVKTTFTRFLVLFIHKKTLERELETSWGPFRWPI